MEIIKRIDNDIIEPFYKLTIHYGYADDPEYIFQDIIIPFKELKSYHEFIKNIHICYLAYKRDLQDQIELLKEYHYIHEYTNHEDYIKLKVDLTEMAYYDTELTLDEMTNLYFEKTLLKNFKIYNEHRIYLNNDSEIIKYGLTYFDENRKEHETMIDFNCEELAYFTESLDNIDTYVNLDLRKYIQFCDFDKTKIVDSKYYGKYNSTRILIVDGIKAFKDGVFAEVQEQYSQIRNNCNGNVQFGSISIETLEVSDYSSEICKFEVYTTVIGDNPDWLDPKYNLKCLPIELPKEQVKEAIFKFLKK